MFLTKTQKTPYLPSVASFPNRYDSAIARNGGEESLELTYFPLPREEEID